MGATAVVCSDKRPAAPGQQLPAVYEQLLGAGEIAWDFAATMEAQAPGSFLDLGMSIEELGLYLRELASRRLKLYWHIGCAALANREGINNAVSSTPAIEASGSTLLVARDIHGDNITVDELKKITDATGRIQERATPTNQAIETIEGHTQLVTLEDTGLAKAFVVSRQSNSGFDVAQLKAQGASAYISTTSALRKLQEAVRTVLPVDPELLEKVYALRAATIWRKFIVQEDGEPYPLYIIDENGVGRVSEVGLEAAGQDAVARQMASA